MNDLFSVSIITFRDFFVNMVSLTAVAARVDMLVDRQYSRIDHFSHSLKWYNYGSEQILVLVGYEFNPKISMSDKNGGIKIISDNRQARYLYTILETYEAGIELLGTEVKSIRQGKVNLRDGYCLIRNGEILLVNVNISPYNAGGNYFNHEPRRDRRLLMHRREINKLIGQIEQKGLTLVPLKMYFKNGWIKVSIGLGKGKKLHDKRESVKRRDDARDMARAMKRY